MPDEKPKKKTGIMALLGVPSDDSSGDKDENDDYEGDSGKMALKAAYRAIKDEDEEGFCEAMSEWMSSVTDK